MEMLNSNWNEERMDRLETLYRDGLSFSLIAAEIGVTRNAAIGKAHRMHLPKRVEIIQCLPGRTANPNSPPRRRRSTVRTAAMSKERPEIKIVPDHDYSCTIIELTDRSCRYPLWHTSAAHAERRYCGIPGASISKRIPYCRRHSKLCGTPREN
jgi:GcrA cell cycle regulator